MIRLFCDVMMVMVCSLQGSGGVENANVAARREINAKIRLNKILLRSLCWFVVCLSVFLAVLHLLHFQRVEGKFEEVY